MAKQARPVGESGIRRSQEALASTVWMLYACHSTCRFRRLDPSGRRKRDSFNGGQAANQLTPSALPKSGGSKQRCSSDACTRKTLDIRSTSCPPLGPPKWHELRGIDNQDVTLLAFHHHTSKMTVAQDLSPRGPRQLAPAQGFSPTTQPHVSARLFGHNVRSTSLKLSTVVRRGFHSLTYPSFCCCGTVVVTPSDLRTVCRKSITRSINNESAAIEPQRTLHCPSCHPSARLPLPWAG